MKILDANILLYAVNSDAPQHNKVRRWLEEILSRSESVAFPWVSLLAFLRLSTKSSIFPKPLSVSEATDQIKHWLDQPNALILDPGPKHLQVFSDLLNSSGAAGNLVTDVHLAAMALETAGELCSCDYDFGRFKNLRWVNPLD